MKLNEYKRTLDYELGRRTLCYLVQENEVLLGLKKRGFGHGKIVGIGGKVESGETDEEAAMREVKEEIGVDVASCSKVGEVDFYFPHADEPKFWNQKVLIFTCQNWLGKPLESDEILPSWYKINNLPYDKMWDDAKYWIDCVFTADEFAAEFIFNKDLKVEDYHIKKKSG